MSKARWLTFLSLLCFVIGCGGSGPVNNGNNDSGTPSLSVSPTAVNVVAGGSPVNFNSTLVHANGTVSWTLSGPGAIAPTTGTTTAYTPPASIGSPTNATLTATSGSLTASATITVTPPGIATVAGSVKDALGKGVAGATVLIGSQQTTTDGTGNFSVIGVTTPYDATVVQGTASRTYKGLTRADPTLVGPTLGSAANHGVVTGSVSGGDALPAPSDKTVVAWGSPETSANANVTTNPWTMNLGWNGASTTTGNVHALQWTPTGGAPTAYKGYGVTTGVDVAGGATVNNVAVAMTAPAASTISGNVALAAGVSLSLKDLRIDFADGASFAVGTALGGTTAFNYAVPDGIGSTATVSASGMYPGSSGTFTRVSGLAAGSTGTTIDLLVPSLYSTPDADATGVTHGTDFTWTAFPGAVYAVTFFTNVQGAPTYFVITSATSARIPDLSALGITLPTGTQYGWTIAPVSPWASVDAYAGGVSGFPSTGTVQFSIATGRKFTTQ